ncbi:MAG: PQQ-binding-like beta-propeller repeat protein [Thermotogae bacterium]|nr:PQQ-binding-like beta-propeller repeat protein [Thermotogota bacterium]
MIVVLLSQSFAPEDYAIGTWYMRNGSLSHSGVQALSGAVTGPDLRCSYGGLTGEGDPLVADINGDGFNEIVFSSYSPARVWAFRGSDCTLLWNTSISTTSWGTAAIGELLPSSSGLEIVATAWNGNVYALRGTDGSIIWNRSLDGSFLQSSVAIMDVDGDGAGEVFVEATSNLYALRGNDGSTIWSRSITGASHRYNSPAIYDVDGDGLYEVVAAYGSTLVVLDAQTGSLEYSVSIGSTDGSPTVADLDGDGDADIVIGTSSGRVVAIDGPSGTVLWNVGVGGNNRGTPSVFDINGDGVKEVVIGDASGNMVYALRGTDGATVWSYSRTYSYEQSLARKMGDIDGDGEIEMVITSYGSRVGSSPMFVILNAVTGTPEWTYDVAGDGTEGAAIGDVDNDNCMEVLVVPDWTSGGGLRVFDSSTPISDCDIIGYDDPTYYEERSNVRTSLEVMVIPGGLKISTLNAAWIRIYSSDGRLVRRTYTENGDVTLSLPSGIYVVKVEGRNLQKVTVVR